MNLKLMCVMPLALSLAIISCDETEAVSQLTNCTRVDAFLALGEDGEAIVDPEAIPLCGRNQAELDAKIALAQSEFDASLAQAIADSMAPEPEPMEGITLTFDDPALDALGNSFSFGDIASINVVTNPVPGETNPEVSSVYEAVVDTNLGMGFNGVGFDFAAIGLDEFDFTGQNRQITVSVWSDVPFTLQAQVGNGRDDAGIDIVDPRPASKTASHSGGGWENLVFDFSTGQLFNPFLNAPGAPAGGSEIPEDELGEISGMYSSLQFQFNGAPADAETTFYIDNINYNPPTPSLEISFDEADLDFLGNSFSFGDIASIDIVDNPELGGTNNTSSLVYEAVVDTNLGMGFNGFGFDIEAIGLPVLNFTEANKQITISVWSNVPFTLQAQVGNGRDEAGVDIVTPRPASKTALHTGGGWEDIVFDFSTGDLSNPFLNAPGAPAGGSTITEEEFGEILGTYSNLQFQFNGAPADAMTTFYIDNVIYN